MPLIPQQTLEMSWIYIRPASPDRKKLYHLQLRLRDPIWEYAKTVCVGDVFFQSSWMEIPNNARLFVPNRWVWRPTTATSTWHCYRDRFHSDISGWWWCNDRNHLAKGNWNDGVWEKYSEVEIDWVSNLWTFAQLLKACADCVGFEPHTLHSSRSDIRTFKSFRSPVK